MSAQPKPLRSKRCKVCRKEFQPFSTLGVVCSVGCAIQFSKTKLDRAKQRQRRDQRSAKREYRERSKTIGKRLQETQRVFNRWIVQVRDKAAGCICCDSISSPIWHAGHYRPTSSHSAMRFDPANVHKQASKCNLYLSGNLTAYRERLIQKIGLAEVERLESDRAPRKWTHQELKAIKADYAKRLREAKKSV